MVPKNFFKIIMIVLSMFAFLSFSSGAAFSATQDLVLSADSLEQSTEDTFLVQLTYSTSDNEKETSGVGPRVHYNSKKLKFNSLDDLYKGSTVQTDVDDTVNDYDNDGTTDKYIQFAWADLMGSAWPGTDINYPLVLVNVNFTVETEAYSGDANVNVSFKSKGSGYTGNSTNIIIDVDGKDAPSTPVMSPVEGFYKAAVSVTAIVDTTAGIKTFYTTDGSPPTTGSTEYDGTATPPIPPIDGADGAKVVVKMFSNYTPEGIPGSVGSAEYTFDKAVPTAIITAPAADAFVTSTDLTIKGTAADTGSGVNKVQVSINGGTWKDATGTATWTSDTTLVKGANAIRVRVYDIAGNTDIITGSTITYYPALALSIDGKDVSGQTVNIPNTAGSNTKIITVTGGSESYSTYTWLPAAKVDVGALTAGASDDKKVYTAEVGKTGTHKIDVVDPVDALVYKTTITFNVVDFSVTGPTTGYVGTALDFIADGQVGDVAWTVTAGEDVAGTPVISGAKNSKATVTPLKAGTFDLSAKDGGTNVNFDVPQVTIYSVPDFSSLPTETVTVNPGNKSDEFTVSGGNEPYGWTVTDPSGVTGPSVSGTSYIFTAPDTGNFAGDYTVKVTESASYSSSFTVYVPLKIDPTNTNFVFPVTGNPQPFTVTGAADATVYTTTIISRDDAAADKVVAGKFLGNSAGFQINPADYTVTSTTGTQQYTLDFEATGHTSPPQIKFDVVPIKTYAGVITDNDGGALAGAVVTVTSPATYEGTTQISAADGAFFFSNLPAPEKGKYQFKVEKTGYISNSFGSADLGDDGLTEIKMQSSSAVISGAFTTHGGVASSMTLVDKDGKIVGASDKAGNPIPVFSDTSGNFSFQFETAPATPVSYTIKASRPGFSGFTTITADSFDYTGVSFAMTAFSEADQITPTNAEPAGSIGVIDSSAGGDCDMKGDPGLSGDVDGSFGANSIKLVIVPMEGGDIVRAALPIAGTYTPTGDSPDSAFEWEIEGLGADGCAVVPVPFELGSVEADKLKTGTFGVVYAHESTPTVWKKAEQVGEIDFIGDGVNGVIYAKICGWSSNVVGIGAVSSSGGTTDDDDFSDCFIGSLSASGTPGNMMAWISILTILGIGIVLTMNSKRKNN